MLEKEIVVDLESGLHARPAAEFVKIASSFESEITLAKNGKSVNAKSIMGVMSLGVSKGDQVDLIVDGSDENEAITTIENFLIGRKSN